MNRNYKAIGLALVAMFALGAFVAQGASASPLTIEGIANGTVFVKGDQGGGEHEFKSAAGTVKCKEAEFPGSGTVKEGKVEELTVTPTYKSCTAFGFATAHVKMNGCTYTFTTPTSLGSGKVTWNGASQLHLVCPSEKVIEITPTSFGVSVCTLTIAAQTPTGEAGKESHVVGSNSGTPTAMHVFLDITLFGIHYIGHGAPCDPEPGGVKTTTQINGSLIGKSTVKCYKNELRTEQVGCTFS